MWPKFTVCKAADAVTAEQIQQLKQGVELRNESGIFAATDIGSTG